MRFVFPIIYFLLFSFLALMPKVSSTVFTYEASTPFRVFFLCAAVYQACVLYAHLHRY